MTISLEDSIERHNGIVSFDIFDTLIIRKVMDICFWDCKENYTGLSRRLEFYKKLMNPISSSDTDNVFILKEYTLIQLPWYEQFIFRLLQKIWSTVKKIKKFIKKCLKALIQTVKK